MGEAAGCRWTPLTRPSLTSATASGGAHGATSIKARHCWQRASLPEGQVPVSGEAEVGERPTRVLPHGCDRPGTSRSGLRSGRNPGACRSGDLAPAFDPKRRPDEAREWAAMGSSGYKKGENRSVLAATRGS